MRLKHFMREDYEADLVANNIKSFYKKYKLYLYIGLFGFIVAFIGVYYWDKYQQKENLIGSKLYWEILEESNSHNQIQLAELFIKQRPNDPYAGWVSLILMNHSLQKGNWQGVDQYGQFILRSNQPSTLYDAAHLLNARKAFIQKNGKAMLLSLNKVKQENNPMRLFLLGNAYQLLNEGHKAREYFNRSADIISTDPYSEPVMKMIWYNQSKIKN
ncbi:MAG: hypothetical protein CMF41_04790 [Legionellales bacterium]|nr:hypothetical protein [Legionellales bacterium]OUX64796.1 MAG: hypothetical protein CBE41_02610 [Gammaproteobacteria bacterium TMED281]